MKLCNSTFSDRPGAHLALNEYGSPFSTAVSTSMRLRNYTICADATTNPVVAPLAGENVVVKTHVNSFLNTDLKELLDQNGIEDVVVVGAMSHMCIDAATRAASDLGYNTTVIQDACATRDLEFNGVTVPAGSVHAAMMAALGFAYAKIVDTDIYLAAE